MIEIKPLQRKSYSRDQQYLIYVGSMIYNFFNIKNQVKAAKDFETMGCNGKKAKIFTKLLLLLLLKIYFKKTNNAKLSSLSPNYHRLSSINNIIDIMFAK